MKTLSFFSLVLLCNSYVFGQYLSPEVLVTAGGEYKNNFASMSITLGETVTETLTSQHFILTQGFQQSSYVPGSNVEEQKENRVGFYPNPVVSILNICLDENPPYSYRFEIIDSKGSICYATNLTGSEKQTIDLSFLPDGLYLIKTSIQNTMGTYTAKMEKRTNY